MTRPAMTEDQRVVAVAMLANAIRRERRRHARADDARQQSSVLSTFGALGRGDGPAEYVRGMRDLLAVLFDGGRQVADACYEAAAIEADGGGRGPDDRLNNAGGRG